MAWSLFYSLMSLCMLQWGVQFGITAQESDEAPFQPLCSRSCKNVHETTIDEQTTGEEYPLYQCSCTRSCSTYGDCCFDSPFKNASTWRTADFVCLSLIGYGTVRAVYNCPPDHLSNFCRNSLGHLPPVTSRTTNITYANTFCAACNADIENLVTWPVELRCANDENDTTSKFLIISRYGGGIWRLNEEDGSKSYCRYHVHFENFSFLEGLELRGCKRPKISDCAASWTDQSERQLCRSYEDPIYFQNTGYRNSHCAKCNYLSSRFSDCVPSDVKLMLNIGLIDSKVYVFCRTRGFTECIQHYRGKGVGYSFSSLLNIRETVCIPPKGRKCCKGEAFSYITQSCLKIVRD